jgi:outer membrane lipoprotein carrier protein
MQTSKNEPGSDVASCSPAATHSSVSTKSPIGAKSFGATAFALVLSLLAFASSASAESESPPAAAVGCAESLAERVQSYYESVVDFRASFEQVTHSITLGNASLGTDAPSRGDVQFAKPGKMRWHYRSPSESVLVSNGEILWIFDPGAGEVQRLPVTKGYLTGAAMEFLLGEGEILKEFEVSAATCTPDAKGALYLKLIPRKAASYEYLGLRAKLATGEIIDTDLVDLFGNKTSISFSEMSTNVKPAAATFEFQVPDGVQVIDLVIGP